jgi:hypothetical protein
MPLPLLRSKLPYWADVRGAADLPAVLENSRFKNYVPNLASIDALKVEIKK